MVILIIGLCLGYIIGQMNSNKYRAKYVKRTGKETGETKPILREVPPAKYQAPNKLGYGTKSDIVANTASEMQPPSGGSNVMPPQRPKAFPLGTSR